MTLLDAHPYDPAKARRRKIKIAVTVVIVVALAALAWMYRNWPEEHSVDKFFTALQHQDYETAYAHLFQRSRLAKTSAEIFSVHLRGLLSRLGTGRRVGSRQVPPDLRIGQHKRSWQRRSRG